MTKYRRAEERALPSPSLLGGLPRLAVLQSAESCALRVEDGLFTHHRWVPVGAPRSGPPLGEVLREKLKGVDGKRQKSP